jgi:Lipase (class 3)
MVGRSKLLKQRLARVRTVQAEEAQSEFVYGKIAGQSVVWAKMNSPGRSPLGKPLDNATASFYGQFVQAAYTMFRNPQGGDALRPEPAGIPAGYELGAWIHMSDFILDVEDPKFYGIVVHRLDDVDSRIIGIRGTEGAIEWIDDAAAVPVPFRQVPTAGRVACGFDKIYSTLKVVKRNLPGAPARAAAAAPETFSGSFAQQLEQLAISREVERGVAAPSDRVARPRRPTIVTGHSLGAALATLFVMENDARRKFDVSSLCTFASPRVGNMEFVRLFNQLPIDSWRIVNIRDVVPKLPPYIPGVLDYGHVDMAYPFNSSDFAKNNLLCWHSMETYLRWLDPSAKLLPECIR